jgi:hypothetical protein
MPATFGGAVQASALISMTVISVIDDTLALRLN